MKKQIIAAALFLMIGSTYASAAGLALKSGQPRVEHNIVSTQLPIPLQTIVKKDYKDYWITECYTTGKKNHEDYFITLENADQAVQLKSNDKTTWELVSTKEKE